MKRLFFFTSLVLAISTSSTAQCFFDEFYTELIVTEDIVYGRNASIQNEFIDGEANPENLLLDLYQPVDNGESDRPLIIVFHEGSFLPLGINGKITGSRKDSSIVEICSSLARRGFVAAAVDYRLGWNPFSASQPERAKGFLRAIYRGIQDGRTAIRFFKKSVAENGDPYKIDPERIACWGVESGSFIVLGMAELTEYNELVTPPEKFLTDEDLDGVLETPIIDTTYLGDMEAKSLSIAPSTAYGYTQGDTLCYPNHPNYNSDFCLSINIGGTIPEISWMEDQRIPSICVQSINDMFTPYNEPNPIIIPTEDLIINLVGAQKIGEYQEANNMNVIWRDLNFMDSITQLARVNSDIAQHPYYEGIFPFVNAPNSNGFDEGVVINWWDPNAIAPLEFGVDIPWNELEHPLGGTYHEQGLILNENMSAEKAKANIDAVMKYVIPRMAIKMGLLFIDNNEDLHHTLPEITVSPNPAYEFIHIQSQENVIEKVEVYALNGELIKTLTQINSLEHMLERENLEAGIYVLQVHVNGFKVTEKIIFQ